MTIEIAKPLDTSVRDHLSGSEPLNVDGYTDVVAPRKSDKQEYLDKGYTVIKESDDDDLIIVGKKVFEVEEVKQ